MDVMIAVDRVRRDERGMSFVLVGFGLTALFAASILSIDVGLLMVGRTQAQSSADAGALAGATALVFNSFTDESAGGPAVTGAINSSTSNLVVGDAPSVLPGDVTFPPDAATGQSDLVQVSVYRTAARNNPVPTFIARLFGTPTVDITATATAAAYPANAESCVLPWTIPDKWIEEQCATETCPWAPGDDFNIAATVGGHPNAGALLANPDQYVLPGPGMTGFTATTDIGVELTLKPGSGGEVTPSFFNAWDVGGVTGAANYRAAISGCSPGVSVTGDDMIPETGNMAGPTQQGVTDLINEDLGAYWDSTCNGGVGCVKGSAFPTSPRVRPVPLYNPLLYAQDQHSGKSAPTLQIVNYLGFFIESVTGGGDVTGRITPILGKPTGGGPPPVGMFARAIVLVK